MKYVLRPILLIFCLSVLVTSLCSCSIVTRLIFENAVHTEEELSQAGEEDLTEGETALPDKVYSNEVTGKVSVYIENNKPAITLFDHPEISDIIEGNAEMCGYRSSVDSDNLTSYISDVYAAGSALTLCYTEESKSVNVTSNVFTFDMTTGGLLSLNDIVLSDKKAELISLFCEKMSEAPYEYFFTPEEAVNNVFSSERRIWGFCKGGLYIRFAPFDVASYALGYINILLPYDKLEGVVKAEYLPASNTYYGKATLCDVYYINDYGITYGEKSSYGVRTLCVSRDVAVYRNKAKEQNYSEKGDILFYSNIFTSDEYVNLPNDGGKYLLDQHIGQYMTGIEIEDGNLLTYRTGK